jgi:four helix bundle protein
MRDFRKLKVWEKAHQLTLGIYAATRSFPHEERYGLTAQARRSSASIPTNVAEGCGRSGPRDLARFLDIASGSASELEYQLLLARDLHYLDGATCERLTIAVSEVKRMLASFLQTLRRGESPPPPKS